jgi:xylan 1,4-beta-xylosidase
MNITNPILPGFNPDPSICRVGGDYYIATSTFEWYPGVQIHHSRDLVHWRLLTRPLRRPSQLDMRGDPDSCGVWAPCLSHCDGLFYLIYTDVKRYGRASIGGLSNASLRDFHNYLVTSDRIDGDWSDPVHLNSSGFDPSLFHDDDGRKYLLNMLWDHRPGQNRFAGIVLQEYSHKQQKLIGQRRLIFTGTPIGFTEGPHVTATTTSSSPREAPSGATPSRWPAREISTVRTNSIPTPTSSPPETAPTAHCSAPATPRSFTHRMERLT